MQPRSAAPLPPPPDIELADVDHAPLAFKPRGLGSTLVLLGVWEIGEIKQADNARHAFEFIVRLPGLRHAWHRPLPYASACDRVVEIARQWIEGADVARFILDRARQAAGDRAGRVK